MPTEHVLRGRGSSIDGHVSASRPSEGGFVAFCAQRVAAAAAGADDDDDEMSGRCTNLSTKNQRLGRDFKAV